MKKSSITKHCVKCRNIFLILSSVMWVGTALFAIIATFSHIGLNGSVLDILSEEAKATLLAVGTTAVIGLIASIFIRDKMRTTIWMLSLVIISVLYKSTGMYITLALWFVEENIFHTLYNRYKMKVSINKEIDLRG